MNSIKVDCKDLVRKKICILIVVQSLSRVQLCVTLWTVAYHTSLSMGILQAWTLRSGWLCPTPGYFPNPGIKLRSPSLQVDSLPTEPPGKLLYTYIRTYTHTHIYIYMHTYTLYLHIYMYTYMYILLDSHRHLWKK